MSDKLLKTFQMTDEYEEDKIKKSTVVLLIIAGLMLGGFTSFFISPQKEKKQSALSNPEKTASVKMSAGIKDEKRFPDKAEGILKEGGIDGEGSFHLVRPGGESQNVYLTSSTVDLSEFLGKKVRVWGETFKGEKAGWLMDVGYIEVIE